MSKRRIGVSSATTEAERRKLMAPVQCWEKVWATPDDAAPGSGLKVYKWVKTDKKQNFSDDEEEPDLPLIPLPDIEETNDGDDDMEQDTSVAPDTASRAVSEPIAPQQETEDTTPAPTKPHPLSMSLVPDSPTPAPELDESNLTVLEEPSEVLEEDVSGPALQVLPEMSGELSELSVVGDIDLAQLGPDGEPFEGSGELAQLQATDDLLGGEAMDQSADPFISPSAPPQ